MIKQWFTQLTYRERNTLNIGTIMLTSIFIYALLWEPLSIARAQLDNIIVAQKVTLHWMNNAAIEVQETLHPTHIVKHSLLSLIDKSTQGTALNHVHKRIEKKGNSKVRVNFKKVSFTALTRWLGQLYTKHQVQVSTITLERLHELDQVKVRIILKW
ncbi:MAG: type II secretion system protein M [Thiomargarita sp.]|nr:type II secretion system protein M [Thiomargarita sp.]